MIWSHYRLYAIAEGKPATTARYRLVIFLTNIAHNVILRTSTSRGGRGVLQANTLHLDIYLMVASAYEPDIYVSSPLGTGFELRCALAWQDRPGQFGY